MQERLLSVLPDNGWRDILRKKMNIDLFLKIADFLKKERTQARVFPESTEVFKALYLTPFKDVKVLLLGQDPYHGIGQAEGLSFSVRQGVKLPPSLKNIFKELKADLDLGPFSSGSLKGWAEQGVLLLNSCLTVREGEPLSHTCIGWENITRTIIEALLERNQPLALILWGSHAVKNVEGYTLTHQQERFISSHPSPFSAYKGFFGSRPFSKVNAFLEKNQEKPIDWGKNLF